MFVVILTAGIDLSVGSVLALAMMSLALANADGWPWLIVILIGPVVGARWRPGQRPRPDAAAPAASLHHDARHAQFVARGLTNLISGGAPISGLADPVRFLGAASDPDPGPRPDDRRDPGERRRLLVCFVGSRSLPQQDLASVATSTPSAATRRRRG